jgi:hypothetical protein
MVVEMDVVPAMTGGVIYHLKPDGIFGRGGDEVVPVLKTLGRYP